MTVGTDIAGLSFIVCRCMASGRTTCKAKIPRCCVTLRACYTRTVMFRYKIIRIVIKSPGLPYGRAVARLTIVRILSKRMIGNFRRSVIGDMTRVAVCVQSDILSAAVTLRTRRRRMSTRERE